MSSECQFFKIVFIFQGSVAALCILTGFYLNNRDSNDQTSGLKRQSTFLSNFGLSYESEVEALEEAEASGLAGPAFLEKRQSNNPSFKNWLGLKQDFNINSRYKFHKKIGSGAFGTVSIGEQKGSKDKVAIKTIKKSGLTDSNLLP